MNLNQYTHCIQDREKVGAQEVRAIAILMLFVSASSAHRQHHNRNQALSLPSDSAVGGTNVSIYFNAMEKHSKVNSNRFAQIMILDTMLALLSPHNVLRLGQEMKLVCLAEAQFSAFRKSILEEETLEVIFKVHH